MRRVAGRSPSIRAAGSCPSPPESNRGAEITRSWTGGRATAKVLLVDDDLETAEVTAYALRKFGFDIVLAAGAREGLRLCESATPDIVLLDVMLPDMSGLEVSRRIHDGLGTPVILVTGRREENDVLRGFESGADDYVTKPFSHRELALRIAAVLRRCAPSALAGPPGLLPAGGLVLDPASHEVLRGERTIRLTRTEFRILHLLALNCGRPVSADRLIHHTWGFHGGDRDALRVHVSHLRRKLGGGIGIDIRTVPGVGYLLPPL